MEWSELRGGKAKQIEIDDVSIKFFCVSRKVNVERSKISPHGKALHVDSRKNVITEYLNDFWWCREQDSEGSCKGKKVNFYFSIS
jgi:hypothetical protein